MATTAEHASVYCPQKSDFARWDSVASLPVGFDKLPAGNEPFHDSLRAL